MAREIKTVIKLDGEKEFKNALSSINQASKVLDSEMKLVTAQFGKTDQGMKGLKATAEVLNKQVVEQKNKISLLEETLKKQAEAQESATKRQEKAKKALEDATAAYGENSKEVKAAQAELTKANTAVEQANKSYSNLQIQLNTANAKLIETERSFEETSKAAKDLKNLQLKDLMPTEVAEKVEKVAKAFEKCATQAGKAATAAAKIGAQTIQKSLEVGTKALTAYATTALSAATAIAKLTGNAAAAADDLNTLSKQTGLSTEQLQKMQYAANLVDVDVETITGSLTKLTKKMAGSSDAFDKLGVSVRDSNGQLRKNEDVFNEVINALGKIENETERDALAMDIFGKSAQELNPLILGGADALKEYGDQAEKAGLILSQDALDGLNKYNDSLDTLKANTKAAGNVIATSFAPKLQQLTDRIGTAVPKISQSFAKMFSGDITAGQEFSRQISQLTDGLLKDIDKMVPPLLGGMNTVILTLVDNIPKAVMTLLPSMIDGLTDLCVKLADKAPEMVPMVIDGAITLFTGLIGGLNKVLDKLIPMLPGIIEDIGNTLIDNADKILDTGFDLLIKLVEGLTAALPKLAEKALQLVPVVVDKLVEKVPELIDAGIELVFKLAEALLSEEGIAKLSEAVVKIVNAIVNKFKETDWADVAEKTFKLLGEGLVNIMSGALSIIDGIFGTHLQEWYDETTSFWRDVGAKMYQSLHADELEAERVKNRAEELKYQIYNSENDLIRAGYSAEEALKNALATNLVSNEDFAIYDKYLKNVVNLEEATSRYTTVKAADALNEASYMTVSKPSGMPSNVPESVINNYTFNNQYNKAATRTEQMKDQRQQQATAAIYGQ